MNTKDDTIPVMGQPLVAPVQSSGQQSTVLPRMTNINTKKSRDPPTTASVYVVDDDPVAEIILDNQQLLTLLGC